MDDAEIDMEHVAIMNRSWGLTRKILSGTKKIESRWYLSRYAPWDRTMAGEVVYFKDSGEPVTIKAEVEKVLQFQDLTPQKVKTILDDYGQADGLERDAIPKFFEMFKEKRYCILLFLKNPQAIEPFEVNKSWFGVMAAWISIENVETIRAKL